MQKLIASVRDKRTKENLLIEREEYKTKKKFAEDLRSNGYAVKFITTPEKFDEDVEKYHAKKEDRNRLNYFIRKAKRDHERKYQTK